MSFDLENIFRRWPYLIGLNEEDFLREYTAQGDMLRTLIPKHEALCIYHEIQRNLDNVKKMSNSEMKDYLKDLYLSL